MPLMKNPDHFHKSPLLGGATRNRTILAFHRGLVSAGDCCMATDVSGSSADKAAVFTGTDKLKCIEVPGAWCSEPCPPLPSPPPAGPDGVAALLPRHPTAPGQRLPGARLEREVQHTDWGVSVGCGRGRGGQDAC